MSLWMTIAARSCSTWRRAACRKSSRSCYLEQTGSGWEEPTSACTSQLRSVIKFPVCLDTVLSFYFVFSKSIQCFDTVGWAAGRASGLQKTEWWGASMVICLERGADLHMASMMPLPLTVSCFKKRAVKRLCVCVFSNSIYFNSTIVVLLMSSLVQFEYVSCNREAVLIAWALWYCNTNRIRWTIKHECNFGVYIIQVCII